MKLSILNEKEYEWIKKSEFYTSLIEKNNEEEEQKEEKEELNIKICSENTEDINLFLDIGNFWMVYFYPIKFYNLFSLLILITYAYLCY